MTGKGFLSPGWPTPPGVRALMTLRAGGYSRGPYRDFNLGSHVGDDRSAVTANRTRLIEEAGLPAEPIWLEQVHGSHVVDLGAGGSGEIEADAATTSDVGVVCVVLTADCLPVLLADTAGRRVAAAHAGWRGLLDGVLEAVVAAMGTVPGELTVWLGPCIGPQAFEIGPEVRSALLAADGGAAEAFRAGHGDRWHADLATLAVRRLQQTGVMCINRADLCTWSDPERFFSHRRDGICGRMASLIWREETAACR